MNLGAFAINLISVSVPGRIDGKMADEAKRHRALAIQKKEAKTEDGTDGGKSGKDGEGSVEGVPRDSMYRSLVTPAGWAFAIWGVIFLTEAVFIAVQAMPVVSLSPGAVAVFEGVSPWCA